MKRSLTVILVVAVALMHVAHAQPSEPERLYLEGQKAYDAQRYDGALIAWLRSYELSKLPALLFNIAQAYRLRGLAGDCAKAMDAYKKFVELDPKSPQRPAADGFITELKACVPPPQAPPPPPPVTSTAAPPGAGPIGGPIGGERSRSDGSTKRLAAYVTGGASVALILTGAYFGNKARSIGDEVTNTCKDGCDWSVVAKRDEEGRSAERTQYVFYGVGAAGVVAAGVLYYLGMRDRDASVALVPQRDGGAAVTWSGAW